MIRYRQSLLFVFVLLVVTGLGLIATQPAGGNPLGFFDTPRGGLLMLAVGIVAALMVLAVVGFVFAGAINFIAGALAEEKAAAGRAPAPAPAKKAETPAVPLYDNRQRAWFYGLIAGGVLLFLIIRAIAAGAPPGYPLDRLPDFNAELLSFDLNNNKVSITAGLALGGAVAVVLGGAVVTGIALAFGTARLGKRTLAEEEKVKAAAEAAKKAAGPAAAKPVGPAAKPAAGEKPPAPAVPLTTDRALTIFYLVVGIGIFVFMLVRWLSAGTPLGYFPTLDDAASATLLKLPGEPVEGWPEWLPGPGGELSALVAFLVLVPVVLGGVVAAGIGLARLMTQFSATEKALEKAEPQWPAPQLAVLEPQLKQIAANAVPRRLTGLDVGIGVLFASILLLLAVWVVPEIGVVTEADNAISATRVAALWTPTPLPGPTPTPGPSPDELFAQLGAGDAAAGKAIAEGKGACAACHIAAQPGAALVGPAWLAAQSTDGKGLAAHVAERLTAADYTGRATSVEAYLYESITSPNAFVVAGFAPNIMPATYSQSLTAQELADLIAYLVTLQ